MAISALYSDGRPPGNIYVQFLASPDEEQLHCESVSATYSPAASGLTLQREALLLNLGFAPPGALHPIILKASTFVAWTISASRLDWLFASSSKYT
jgi:hypothetical protein